MHRHYSNVFRAIATQALAAGGWDLKIARSIKRKKRLFGNKISDCSVLSLFYTDTSPLSRLFAELWFSRKCKGQAVVIPSGSRERGRDRAMDRRV